MTSALVIGGGVDGLVAATLLARAGRRVTLVESRDALGGRCSGEEFAPGYTAPGLLNDASGLRPVIVDELQLATHGLRFADAPEATVSPAVDGTSLVRHADDNEMVARLRRISEPDAWTWRRWKEQIARLGKFVGPLLDGPAPDPEPADASTVFDLLRTGIGLQRLSRADRVELLRIGPMAARDWLQEQFQTPRLQALLSLPALIGTRMGPWSPGSAILVLMHEITRGPQPLGGPAAVANALARAAEAAGVTFVLGRTVRAIRVSDGRATGVVLDDDQALDADDVLAAIEPKRALLGMLPKGALPHAVAGRLRHWRTRGTTSVLRLGLSGPPPWRGVDRAESVARLHLADDLSAIESASDAMKYGELPERPVLDVAVPTVASPELAPKGHHVLTALVHATPYALTADWGAPARAVLRERTLAVLEHHAPGISERIVGEQLLVPTDLEQRYGLTGGQLHHGEPALDQLLHMRPDPSCSRGATPVAGLWLGGAGCHPAGDVAGTAGRQAARALLAGRR